MRGLWLVAAFGLAAWATGCFHDRGVALEVDVGTTGATSVELYLGKAACGANNTAGIDCKTIAPPAGLIALAGDIWFRDDLTPVIADVKGHTATFQITSDSVITLPIVVAVGFGPGDQGVRATGAVTLRELAIPVNSARVVTAALVAANAVVPADTDTRNLDEDRVLVWRKTQPASSCVVVERWQQGKLTSRDFVVPAEDPDCDDVKLECNPAAYHGASDASTPSGKPDCLSSANSRCVLGSHGCTDDGGVRTGTCAPQVSQVCVPQVLCACMSLDPTCTDEQINNHDLNMIPRIECDVPTRLPASGVDLCMGKDTGAIDLSAQFAGGECGHEPQIGSLQLGGFDTTSSFGGAVMALSSAGKPCSFSVKWTTGTRTVAAPEDHGMVRIATGHGALLVPIVFHFKSLPTSCVDTPFACSVKGNPTDSLWSCAP
jgi:hypothetical protein